MLPVYDQFFATPEIIQHKTSFGHIKACNDRFDLNCDFTTNHYLPCSIFLYAGNRPDEYVEDELLEHVIELMSGNKDSILYLDTIIEDFVHYPFISLIEKLLKAGILPNNIKVITSYNPAESFRTRFFNLRFLMTYGKGKLDNAEIGKQPEILNKLQMIDIISYNGFCASYVIHKSTHESDLGSPLSEIKGREFKKHFSLLQKNSRFLRKIVHSYFLSKGYDKLSYYSWHNVGVDSLWGDKEEKALATFNIPFDKEKFMRPILFDDVEEPGGIDEWSVPDVVKNQVALSIVVETCNTRDEADSLFAESFHHRDAYFLSEKTFKNFYYGLPFIHLGMPFIDMHLENMGYFTFRHLFKTDDIPVETNTDGLVNDFMLIDKIASMSLDQLSDILNSEKRLNEYKHNKKMLGRLIPLKNLINVLDKY